MRAIPSSLDSSRNAASAIRRVIRYRYMDWPTSFVKRAENAERPSPTRRPRLPRVQGWPGRSWISWSAGPMCGSAIAPSHPPSAGLRDLTQLRNTSTKRTSVSLESAMRWPGRSTAPSLTMRCRIDSSHSPSSVGLRRSTGGSNSNTLPREGRAMVKFPQIIVETGSAPPP